MFGALQGGLLGSIRVWRWYFGIFNRGWGFRRELGWGLFLGLERVLRVWVSRTPSVREAAEVVVRFLQRRQVMLELLRT